MNRRKFFAFLFTAPLVIKSLWKGIAEGSVSAGEGLTTAQLSTFTRDHFIPVLRTQLYESTPLLQLMMRKAGWRPKPEHLFRAFPNDRM